MTSLTLHDLHKIYRRRGQPEVPAVQGISLEVEDGELVGLLGPSGCGKSSTLRMIAGLEEVTRGDIRLDGKSIVNLPPHRRNIGVAFENYALYPPLTVAENIAFGLRARRHREIEARIQEIAERLEITDILSYKPGRLSTGQKQRVSLARALARRPSVLLLDEPLSHLDAVQQESTRRELKRLHDETGYTTILVTHDQREALSLADRIAVMNEGRILHVGTPDDIFDDPGDIFVAEFVGEPPINFITGHVQRHDSIPTVTVTEGVELLVAARSPAHGAHVTLGIRPGDIQFAPDSGENTLPGQVVVFETLPETGIATVELPGVDRHLTVETRPDERLHPGQPVHLRMDPDRILLFNPKTGDRIR